jgi:hypothetical protein
VKRTKRWLHIPVLALAVASCQDFDKSVTGPGGSDLAPLFSHTGSVTSCLDLADHPPSAETPQLSPCDGRLNGGLDGFFLLPSLVSNPNVTDPLVTGLAAFLRVEAVVIDCPTGDCSDPGQIAAVVEGTGSYSASWKTRKRGTGSQPAESAWRLKVWLTNGSADSPEDVRLLGYRDVILSESPSTDQPSDDPALVIQLGSNQNVPFYITQDLDTCLTSGEYSITCLIGDGGGTLDVTGPSGTALLNIGPDNGTNVFTLRMENCGAYLDVDVPLIGCRVDVESPTLAQAAILNESTIEICEVLDFGDAGDFAAYVLKVDERGHTVLPPAPFNCSGASSEVASAGFLGLLNRGLGDVVSLFTPQPLLAATMVGAVSGGGGRLRDLSGFQLGVLPKAEKLSGDGASLGAGQSVTVEVQVTDANDQDTPFTTIHFFPDPGGSAVCPSTLPDGAHCLNDATTGDAVFTTGDNGIASAVWTPAGTGTVELRALGCGVAVAGSDTPTEDSDGDFVLGTPAPDGVNTDGVAYCDRDPTDSDDGSNGYANGPVTGLDPFETKDDTGLVDYEVALNDLPLVFTAQICSVTVDGIKDASWDECAAGEETFPVNLSGGGGKSGATATLRWLNTPTDLILSLELPRSSDESSTSLWFEFIPGDAVDPGDGSGSPSENDDLIGLERKSGISTASDRHLDATCAGSSGSSVCGAIDTSQDVNAEVRFNDGGFIFYEISHPLTGGGLQDFDLESGETVALFLRLAIGNGAQGKTIWPGFRFYHLINIQ